MVNAHPLGYATPMETPNTCPLDGQLVKDRHRMQVRTVRFMLDSLNGACTT